MATQAAKQLETLLEGVEYTVLGDIDDTEITGICSDSRRVRPGNLFAAIRGYSVDGHRYLGQAVSAGCATLLVEPGWQENNTDADARPAVPVVEVADTRKSLGFIAANFYDHPDKELNMIGVTGTNGKTTTTYLVESMLSACGGRPGVIGTVNYRFHDRDGNQVAMAAPLTTPEAPDLFALIRRMADEKVTDVVMEVSSHALAQERLCGIGFDTAVFTNLSRDHLDFHPDMHHYFMSKKLLFTDYLKPGGNMVIVLNNGAPVTATAAGASNPPGCWGSRLQGELKTRHQAGDVSQRLVTCGMQGGCDVHPESCRMDTDGIRAEIATPAGPMSLASPLVGAFNLRNILCAIGIGIGRHPDLACLQQGLQAVKTIPGRLERVHSPGAAVPAVFVDYAHTPDALENVLQTLLQVKIGRLVCVFGCGGDRDPGKRALMGETAGKLCDVVLATSDNPRSESPLEILTQVEEGLARSTLQKRPAGKILLAANGHGYDIIEDRRRAIAAAIRSASPDDLILVSGKGHEDYQLGSKGKIYFDDRVEADMQLQARGNAPHAWKLEWVQQVTGARLLSPVTEPVSFSGISTDSRTIRPGNLFVALAGENFDGRKFARQAVSKGAAGLLVNIAADGREEDLAFPGTPTLIVPDSLEALGQLAGFRRRWGNRLQVIAITGSSGKTTVKEMTGAILRQRWATLKTEGNFNNLVGLPLTLFRLQPEDEIALLEMGMNRPGEIGLLTEIADPDIACITNVQEAHLEGLGDIQGVAQAKNELFAGLQPGGKAVVNLDDENIRALAESLGQEKITFGCSPGAFVRATAIQSLAERGMSFALHIGSATRQVSIKGLGRHNVTNSLAAAAMAHTAGCTIDEIGRGLAAFKPYDKRICAEELYAGIRVLNDSYNANPASMLAALNTLEDVKRNNRGVAILGDMLELGRHGVAAHLTLGKQVKECNIEFLAAFGSLAMNIVTGARDAGMAPETARHFRSKEELAGWLAELVRTDRVGTADWLLVKGSRGMRMEEVLDLLRHTDSPLLAGGN
jgi:murE/murF fusion protein